MTAPWTNEKIKAFVKDTLGCGCPGKVFERIDVSKLPAAGPDKDITRIVVGDTLLIYIIRPGRPGELVDSVEAVGMAGKNDRDTNRYNRFRLVVSGVEESVQQEEIAGHFSALFNTDEKMHIHFVAHELVDGLS